MEVWRSLVPFMVAVLGCGRVGFAPQAELISVEKVYPLSAQWNEYVERDWATDVLHATDAPCPHTSTYEQFYDACLHAADKLVVAIDELASCDGLTFGDELGAFDWICSASDGVQFHARGLLPTRGLADLVDADRWKPNRFEVRRGDDLLYVSERTAWWSNPVVPLPDNATGPLVMLDQPSTIYTLASSRETTGYHIAAAGVGFVTLGNAVLSFGVGAPNCNTGVSTSDVFMNATSRCALSAQFTSRLWIEGAFDGGTASPRGDTGVLLFETSFSVLRGVRATNHAGDGMRINYTNGMLADGVVATGNALTGFHDHYSKYNILRDLVVANNGERGMFVYDGGPWRITNVRALNNGTSGIYYSFDALGVLANVLAVGNGGHGVEWTSIDLPQSTANRIVAVSNGGDGVRVGGMNFNTLSHVVAINNAGNGIGSQGNLNNESRLAQLVSANNGGFVLAATNFTGASFEGNFVHGSNVSESCSITGGTNPGIDALCQSAANRISGVDARNSFVGPMPTTAPQALITSWDTDGSLVTWGRDALALDVTARGRCDSGTCRQWDFALVASDAVLRDAARTGRPAPEPFVIGATCPAAVHGDRVLLPASINCDYDGWRGSCLRTFLVDAIELDDDYLGNDDGLCESSEACVYAPSFGLDQGRGALAGPCVFEDGAVSGVSMYARDDP